MADSADSATDFLEARKNMVQKQLVQRGIKARHVLQAMLKVPRHSFVSQAYQKLAYRDMPLPIGYNQTISQPYIVAFMIEALGLKAPYEAKILEIGTGLGYQAAVLSQFAQNVYTVERIPALAVQAKQTFVALDYQNIHTSQGDGGFGWQAHAPYDGILVAAAAPKIPQELLQQLKPGAALIIPVGKIGAQKLLRIQQVGRRYRKEALVPVAFVPLLGARGWAETKQQELS